ncbi:MAG: hypothetical protein K8S24_04665 [Candidatus Aegiribacteria sp.]|nr:hypothetical protein [Candidatus Aegiribacteria sp.]
MIVVRIIYIYAILILVLVPSVSVSQDQSVNVRDLHPSRFSFVIGGINLIGISFDTFLSSNFNLELSAGFGVGAGLRYHPTGADTDVRWSPYLGGYFGLIPAMDFNLFGSGGSEDLKPNLYIPAGVHYISMSGKFSIAFEGGYMYIFEANNINSAEIPMIGIKIHLSI